MLCNGSNNNNNFVESNRAPPHSTSSLPNTSTNNHNSFTKQTPFTNMLQRIETMPPESSSNDDERLVVRPRLVSDDTPIIECVAGNNQRAGSKKRRNNNNNTTSARIRDDTMELLPMPPRKRLRRAPKVYSLPPNHDQQQNKCDVVQPTTCWWNRIQVGDDESERGFNGWHTIRSSSSSTITDGELERENEAFAMRSSTGVTISGSCSSVDAFF